MVDRRRRWLDKQTGRVSVHTARTRGARRRLNMKVGVRGGTLKVLEDATRH